MSSGAGQFWMRGYLFVADHPYYTRTDADGSYRLTQVPPGDYRLVCWLPNYRIQRRERDPENGLVTRLVYGPPLATEQPVHVETKQNMDVTFTIVLRVAVPAVSAESPVTILKVEPGG